MGVDIWAVLAAAAVMFAVGAIWYMGLFSKQWGHIHGFDKLDKKTQKEMQSKMTPFYFVQIVITIFTAFVLAKLAAINPDYSIYSLALLVWFGFMLPVQASAVIFGGTKPEFFVQKIAIMSGESLVHTLAAVWVISLIQ